MVLIEQVGFFSWPYWRAQGISLTVLPLTACFGLWVVRLIERRFSQAGATRSGVQKGTCW